MGHQTPRDKKKLYWEKRGGIVKWFIFCQLQEWWSLWQVMVKVMVQGALCMLLSWKSRLWGPLTMGKATSKWNKLQPGAESNWAWPIPPSGKGLCTDNKWRMTLQRAAQDSFKPVHPNTFPSFHPHHTSTMVWKESPEMRNSTSRCTPLGVWHLIDSWSLRSLSLSLSWPQMAGAAPEGGAGVRTRPSFIIPPFTGQKTRKAQGGSDWWQIWEENPEPLLIKPYSMCILPPLAGVHRAYHFLLAQPLPLISHVGPLVYAQPEPDQISCFLPDLSLWIPISPQLPSLWQHTHIHIFPAHSTVLLPVLKAAICGCWHS